jgi:hypothetical protein
MAIGMPFECCGKDWGFRRLLTGEFGRCGECGEFGGSGGISAKLELRLVDTQRLDAMVKRGWWNAKLRRGP